VKFEVRAEAAGMASGRQGLHRFQTSRRHSLGESDAFEIGSFVNALGSEATPDRSRAEKAAVEPALFVAERYQLDRSQLVVEAVLANPPQAFQPDYHAKSAVERPGRRDGVEMRPDQDRRFFGLLPETPEHVGGSVHLGPEAGGPELILKPPPRLHIRLGEGGPMDTAVVGSSDFRQFFEVSLETLGVYSQVGHVG
jgi:hypothetical protein